MGAESCNIPDNTFTNLDIQLPTELREGILDETKSELLDCFIDSLNLQTDSEIFLNHFKQTLKEYGNMEFASILQLDSEYIRDIIESTLENLGNSNDAVELEEFIDLANIDYRSYIIINGVSINFLNYFNAEQVEEVMGVLYRGEERTSIDLIESSVPISVSRPVHRSEQFIQNMEYLGDVENELEFNQFEVLRDEGFSMEMINFIQNELFSKVCGEGYECNIDTIKRIKTLCLFVIDIETTAGKNLRNGEVNGLQTLPESSRSSASGYFQQLNQHGRDNKNSAGDIEYNTIDTNLRYAADFYNNGILSIPSEKHEYKLREVSNIDTELTPDGQWVKDLWSYNRNGRDAIDFSFEDQAKMFLIRTMFENPGALRNVLLNENTREGAEGIYRAHHTGVSANQNTQDRLDKYLDLYYLN